MQIVRLSSDDYEAARQIVAWLAYPDNELQRQKAEHTLLCYWERIVGKIPRYPNGKAVEIKTTRSRMQMIDARFFEAIQAGEISTLSIVKLGAEVAPWPVKWGAVGRKLSEIPAIEDGRGKVYQRYWRRYRPVLHIASAVNGFLASKRGEIDWAKPLDFLLLDGGWVGPALDNAADIKKYSDPKMHRMDQRPALIDFLR